ncbi:spore cortex biosynthesis protein YabQ [Thermosediminibacter oceani]|uniref:Spore cortex biosynthesis protein YabQ n=1 Tax=Thermosediminibacter oceani (strain ATCC BAA-1034 / DSM 16646 / JW/IW-1228P) TaxID=555079 RepID=D9RZK0_THEOJ|nr:spore cortex biosynthesis protein YabQ [Thermosediminibacter oceani]ADL06898.1 spore cortex biosynthesis protein YabQ [Thermosediminibacter oceani DSM 16646]
MNTVEVDTQLIFLAGALASGAVAGLAFDVYRRLRNYWRPGPFLTALGDLAYWALTAAITFYVTYRINYGQVRGYLFLGFGVGLLLYITAVSPRVIRIFLILERTFSKIFILPGKVFRRITGFKAVRLVKRILSDARRVFSKIKKG